MQLWQRWMGVALLAALFGAGLEGRAQEPEQQDQSVTPAPQAATVPRPGSPPSAGAAAPSAAKPPEKKEEPEQPPVVTRHTIRTNGHELKYTATAGLMPIKNADGDTEAHIFYIAYTLDNPPARRPLLPRGTCRRWRARSVGS